MNVLVCCVNYNTDASLGRFLCSIKRSANAAGPDISVTVHVIDNSTRPDAERSAFVDSAHLSLPECNVIFTPANLGYFGALPVAQNVLSRSPASVVIFSNADITLADDFFSELAKASHTDAAVLAPAIISELGNGFDQNPKHTTRVPRGKLRLLSLIYSFWLTFFLQQFAGYLKELVRGKRTKPHGLVGDTIYAPHGALFIFTDPDFFADLPKYEPFLFGEELFVAEEALRAEKSIAYVPSIRVFDSRHASTGSLGSRRRRKLMKASIDFILRQYH